jgi:hypothetical protein
VNNSLRQLEFLDGNGNQNTVDENRRGITLIFGEEQGIIANDTPHIVRQLAVVLNACLSVTPPSSHVTRGDETHLAIGERAIGEAEEASIGVKFNTHISLDTVLQSITVGDHVLICVKVGLEYQIPMLDHSLMATLDQTGHELVGGALSDLIFGLVAGSTDSLDELFRNHDLGLQASSHKFNARFDNSHLVPLSSQ